MLLFPEVDEVMPHAVAFARLMIAHAKFEAEVRYLQGAVAGDQAFGEQPCNQWNTRDRPGRMAKLIKDKLGDVEEAQPITDLPKSAVKPTDDRNLLAHGQWWCFQQGTSALTVRRSTIRKGEPLNVDWTAAEIDLVTESFRDLEVELFKIRRDVERNWFEANMRTG